MKNTLVVLVTCCREQTRFDVLQKVVSNLNEENKTLSFKDDVLVFDNNSCVEGTRSLLQNNFQHVLRSDKNVGFWTAIHWSLQNYETVMHRTYEYVYIIESDLIHYDMKRLNDVETLMNDVSMKDVGCVRCEEFEYANRNLYNKDVQLSNSRMHAWTRHYNAITNSSISYEALKTNDGKTHEEMLLTNFVPKIPAFHRLKSIKETFETLATMNEFTEFDYQKIFFAKHPVTAQLDGGIFHCKLTYQSGALSASYSTLSEQRDVGYIDTRTKCNILSPEKYKVTQP